MLTWIQFSLYKSLKVSVEYRPHILVTGHNITYSFIPVKTECSTLQSVTQDSDYIHVASAYAATQDSNQWHDCHAEQPQPGLAQRLPHTDGAKVLPTSDQVGFHLASTHQVAPQHTSDWTGLLLIYRPRKDERLSWPSWLICSGRLTHTVVTRRLQAERRTGSVLRPKTGVLPTVLRN